MAWTPRLYSYVVNSLWLGCLQFIHIFQFHWLVEFLLVMWKIIIFFQMELLQIILFILLQFHGFYTISRFVNSSKFPIYCNLFLWKLDQIRLDKWRPPSLSELTQLIFNMGLTHLGSEASIFVPLYRLPFIKSLDE